MARRRGQAVEQSEAHMLDAGVEQQYCVMRVEMEEGARRLYKHLYPVRSICTYDST